MADFNPLEHGAKMKGKASSFDPMKEGGIQRQKTDHKNESIFDKAKSFNEALKTGLAAIPGVLHEVKAPGILPNIPAVKSAGDLALEASMMAPGKFAGGLLKSPEGQGIAKELAKKLGNYAGYVGQNAAVGAGANAIDQKDVGEGALMGGALAAALPLAAKGIGGAIKAGKFVKGLPGKLEELLQTARNEPQLKEVGELQLPEQQAPSMGKALLEQLGKGSENKEDAGKQLASMIRDKHNQHVANAEVFFKHANEIAGKNKLYEPHDPLVSTAPDKEKELLRDLKGLKLGSLFDKFKNNPNIENAHWLKSQLGEVLGDLKSNTDKTPLDRDKIAKIKGIRKRIESDIMDAFKRHDASSNDNTASAYQRGVDLFRENVAPYRESKGLRDITVKGVENPGDISKLFKNPTSLINKEGMSMPGHIQKILSDLPTEAKDLILYQKAGASKHLENPKGLVKALNNASNEGFSSHFSDKLNRAIDSISNQIQTDERLAEEAKRQHKSLADEIAKANIESLKKQKEAKKKLSKLKNYGLGSAAVGLGALGSSLGLKGGTHSRNNFGGSE